MLLLSFTSVFFGFLLPLLPLLPLSTSINLCAFRVLVLFCSVLKLTEDCWNCSGFLTDSSDPICLWLLVRVLGV